MVEIKLKNVSVKYGKKFRHNQNHTMAFFKKDGVDADTTEEDIKELLRTNYSDKVTLNKSSQLTITLNSYKQ